MTPSEAIGFLRTLGACEPALVWLASRISKKPKMTLLDVWKELLKLEYIPDPEHPSWRPPVGTHLGYGWLAWLCWILKVPCRNGTFSGMDKVKDGPPITGIDPNKVINLLEEKYRSATVRVMNSPLNGCAPSDLVTVVYTALGEAQAVNSKPYLFLSVDEVREEADVNPESTKGWLYPGCRITLFQTETNKKFSLILYEGMLRLEKVSEVVP